MNVFRIYISCVFWVRFSVYITLTTTCNLLIKQHLCFNYAVSFSFGFGGCIYGSEHPVLNLLKRFSHWLPSAIHLFFLSYILCLIIFFLFLYHYGAPVLLYILNISCYVILFLLHNNVYFPSVDILLSLFFLNNIYIYIIIIYF